MADDQPDLSIGDQGMPKHTPSGTGELSVREAANSHLDWQRKLRAGVSQAAIERPKSEPNSQPESAPEAPAADKSADAETGSPERETTDEGQAQAPDSETPTIEPPPSWTEEALTRWSKLDRETQEYIANRDREDKAAIKRKFQEAEEQGKKQLEGFTAREQAMEQARLQFEAINQAQLQALQATLQGEFSDIQNMEDVKKLANEDWARYLRWDAHQKDIAAKTAQANEAQQRQAAAQQERFAKFAQEQDKKFIERVPEFADKDKAAELQKAAIKTLTDIGFSQEELARYWNGQDNISLRDARIQEVFHKAAKYDAAQAAAKKVVANKTLLPVQRPGVAQQSNGTDAKEQDLIRKSRNSTGMQQLRYEAELQGLRQERGRSR